MSKYLLTLILSCVLCGSVSGDERTTAPVSAGPAEAIQAEIAPWGFDLIGMQKNVHPGDNFFDFANGNWVQSAEILPNHWSAGPLIDARAKLKAQADEIVGDILVMRHESASDAAKFVHIYRSYLDRRTVQRLRLRPIFIFLKDIENARTHEDIATLLGDYRLNAGGFLSVRFLVDPLGGEGYVPTLDFASLLLGSNFSYLDKTPGTVRQQEDAVALLTRWMRRIGERRRVEQRVRAVLALEAEIAALTPESAVRRDPHRTTAFRTLSDLEVQAPEFPWAAYFQARGIADVDGVQVALGSSLSGLSALFRETSVKVWQDYLSLRLINQYGAYISDPLARDVEAFTALRRGVDFDRLSRKTRARNLAQDLMPDVVGRYWVERYLDPNVIRQAMDIAENIRSAYRGRIEKADWMSDATRAKALAKLAALTFVVGEPASWNDYSGFKPSKDLLFGNVYWRKQVSHESALYRLRETRDNDERDIEELRSHIFFSPLQTGAYYMPRLNTVVIPAGYLQAPYFDQYADPAVNYGALGTTIGHEIGHAFDDQGSKYGPEGQLENWWQAEDRLRFDKIGDALSAQFSIYEAVPGVRINTALTLGENLSDLAGLEVAYAAYRQSQSPRSVDLEKIGTQRFFLGYAQKRRSIRHPHVARELAFEDPHSPPVHRVNGIVRNVDAWYEAFDIRPDHALWLAPEDRVKLW